MQIIRIKIDYLLGFGDADQSAGSVTVEAISNLLKEHLPFLPRPISIEIQGDEVILSFEEINDTKKEEAKRLGQKGAKRAQQGDYDKAIGIFKTVLEMDPLLHSARRDLAMVYVEMNDADNAINHLIEVLRMDPANNLSWVILANLYINQKSDFETGGKFLLKALEINPKDSYALNSLGALKMDKGDFDKALELFDQSILANPLYPNPYYGKALTLLKMDSPEDAENILEQLFEDIKKQDVRSDIVFDQARDLYVQIQKDIAERNQLVAAASVSNYISEIEGISGFPTRIEEKEFEDLTGATIQMAWKHHRDYHLLLTRKSYPPVLLSHLEVHELTHAKFEAQARANGKNRFFTTTSKSNEFALRSLSQDLKKFEKEGHSKQWIDGLSKTLIEGLVGFLFNCPLDMIIERHIQKEFPALKHAQFLSLRKMADEALKVNTDPTLRKFTPKKIMQASLALNGAFALFLDDMFQGATEYAKPYTKEESFATSHRIYEHFISHSVFLAPGEEYKLIDDFANILGIAGWYEWKDDPMIIYSESDEEGHSGGVTNEKLLEAKSPASVMYLLSAIKRFEKMNLEEVEKIGYEIALLGSEGIDYTNANKRYNLRTLPGEKFTGLQLMTLMFVAWKKFAPEKDLGIDFHNEYVMALKMIEGKDGE